MVYRTALLYFLGIHILFTSKTDSRIVLEEENVEPVLTIWQEENGYCVLPPQIHNGRYTFSERRCPNQMSNPACQLIPGTPVPPKWAIYHSCNPGYKVDNGKMASVCSNGIWIPPVPVCVVASCKLPEHPSHGYYVATNVCKSYIEGVNACRDIPGSVVPPAWTLNYTCVHGYKINSTSALSVCEDGVWTNPIDCVEGGVVGSAGGVVGSGSESTTYQGNKNNGGPVVVHVSGSTTNPGTNSEQKKKFACPVPDLLPFGDHSRHPMPGNCYSYIICLPNGSFSTGSCELGKAYNKSLGICAPAHTVQC